MNRITLDNKSLKNRSKTVVQKQTKQHQSLALSVCLCVKVCIYFTLLSLCECIFL